MRSYVDGLKVSAVLLAALLSLFACSPSDKPAPTEREQDLLSEDEIARLRSLGYLDFAPATEGASGTIHYDEERSDPGYNLYTSRNLRLTELIDARGKVVNSWHAEDSGVWVRSVLLPNGDLVVLGWYEEAGVDSRYVLRLSWEGEIIWKRDIPVHHDISAMPDGNFILITMNLRSLPEITPYTPVRDDRLVVISQDGKELRHRSVFDMIRARTDVFTLEPAPTPGILKRLAFAVGLKDPPPCYDCFHGNAVEWIGCQELEELDPLYSCRNVIVTFRHLDAVMIFDWDRAELVWAWGPGEIFGPHDATVLSDGHILIFDNGLGRNPRWSRVIELDPLSRRIVWEYRAPEPTDFYTPSRGSAQRLSNGNTLIAESDAGRAFEVTPSGSIVWEYLNPNFDSRGNRATIIRMDRYTPELIEEILAQAGESETGGD